MRPLKLLDIGILVVRVGLDDYREDGEEIGATTNTFLCPSYDGRLSTKRRLVSHIHYRAQNIAMVRVEKGKYFKGKTKIVTGLTQLI